MDTTDLIEKLQEVNIVQHGSFTLKSGEETDVYVDLRTLISHPVLFSLVTRQIGYMMENLRIKSDLICGVPYAALPIATLLSANYKIPMIIKRKERKMHGTKKEVEGLYEKGMTCLIIEDVVTSGQSVLEVIEVLEREGLKVEDIISVVDREQGARELLESRGYDLHTLLSLTDIMTRQE